MTVNLKVNPNQFGLSNGLSKAQTSEGATKKLFLASEKWNLEREFKNVRKMLKLSISLIKFHWRQQLLSGISKVIDI